MPLPETLPVFMSIYLWHWYNYKQEWLVYVAQSKISKFIRLYLKNSNGLFWGHSYVPLFLESRLLLPQFAENPCHSPHSLVLASTKHHGSFLWITWVYETTKYFSVCCLTVSQNCYVWSYLNLSAKDTLRLLPERILNSSFLCSACIPWIQPFVSVMRLDHLLLFLIIF